MKRFGEKATREALANGATIRAWDWYTLQAGYRVIIGEATAGYITGDLFAKLKNDGTIVKDYWAHSYTDYKAAAETTQEAAEAAATAQEWDEESDRVQAATLAALAPVIAAEEAAADLDEFAAWMDAGSDAYDAAPAGSFPGDSKEAAAEEAEEAEEAQEDAAPEHLDERWPESNQQPGIVYILEWNTPGSASHHTRAETVADVHDHVQQIARLGGRITSAKRYDETTGKFREFIPETRQEKTDRENREHCRRIAEELEAYADGRVYRCPDCGREYTWEQVEESEHEDDCGWTAYTCPGCGSENREDAWEQLSLYDFFADCLDIEYRCGSDRQYRSVSIMVACGGPNIYIDTAEKAVLLYWWTDRARHYLSSDAVDAVDDWAEEYWNCL